VSEKWENLHANGSLMVDINKNN